MLVQAGGESYLIDAGRAEESPNIVDFLRDRGVRNLDDIIVSNPGADHIGPFLDVFDAFPVETVSLRRPQGHAHLQHLPARRPRGGLRKEVVRAGMLLDWGVQADACIPKHPASRDAVSCHAG